MVRLHFVLLITGLCFLHQPVAQAATTPQEAVISEPSSTQNNTEIVPGQAPAATSDTSAHQRIPSTPPAQGVAKKQRYLAEEMTMQRAWMYSALLPGWGQVYNKHYWKVPALYAVLAGLGWGGIYNHQEYAKAKSRLQSQGGYQLKNAVDDYRRNRDLCFIFMGFFYLANIFDAYVGASLKTFNLSDDISMQVQPSIVPRPQHFPTVGLSLSLNF